MSAGAASSAELRQLLDALAAVDVTDEGPLARWLDVTHVWTGRERWPALMAEVIARPPADVQEEAGARVQAAPTIPTAAPALVHGDLAGDDLRWHADGRLAAVIDWDLASAWDPTVDVARPAWFGWSKVAEAVDGEDGATVAVRLVWTAAELRPPPRPGWELRRPPP